MGCGTSANSMDAVAPPKEISKMIDTSPLPEALQADLPVNAEEEKKEETREMKY